MRMRQEVRREVQTLSAEGRMSGYVLFGMPIFLAVRSRVEDPGYLNPMLHGAGLIVLIGAAGLMALGFSWSARWSTSRSDRRGRTLMAALSR